MNQVLEDISRFIFLEDALREADVLFIPGNSSPEPMEQAVRLWKEGYAPLLCPSGRFSITRGQFEGPARKQALYPGPYATEWAFMADIGARLGVPPERILREDQATYTMQNAVFSRQVLDQAGVQVRRGLLCCKNSHARRAYMYYQYAFPEAEFTVCPVEVDGVSRENWFQTEDGIQKVMGELARCGQQFPDLIPGFAGEAQ